MLRMRLRRSTRDTTSRWFLGVESSCGLVFAQVNLFLLLPPQTRSYMDVAAMECSF